MDKVSIIVPVYKVEKYLSRCVESLINQTYRNLEILLVDDASPDNSRRIIKEFAEKDLRVRPLYQEHNLGVSQARNRGLEEMTGDWVCFCDGDDWYDIDYVEKMLQCASREMSDYIICNYKIVSEHGPTIISGSLDGIKDHHDRKYVIACGPTSSCTHMIRKELFDIYGIRYPTGCKQNEELPVIPVLAMYAKKIAVLEEPLYNYYQRGDGSSASNMSVGYEENFIHAWKLMHEKLGNRYKAELQYHAIYVLMYGKILEMCKHNIGSVEVKQKIAEYEQMLPDCWENVYLMNLSRAKRIFLWMERKRWICGLRFLAWVHGKIVK